MLNFNERVLQVENNKSHRIGGEIFILFNEESKHEREFAEIAIPFLIRIRSPYVSWILLVEVDN